MIEPLRRQRLLGQALFVLLFMAIVFARLLPLAPGRIAWPGPDLGLCLTLAWVLRRPDQIPVLTIAALYLIEDLLFLRPPGLGAALVVLASESARRREPRWRHLPFVIEWWRVAMLIAVLMVLNRFILTLFFLPTVGLGQVLLHWIATVAAYPLIALLIGRIPGLSRNPAEREARLR
ncbi:MULTISPECIES: rod shape-determining protein MreD [unclassified Paracoccus (in: a-proteobacteria)]|uniref:rod shape-determining protein MreD n=1 Tax=unclassified Paracoccus (in: a-proteobacteria) TaxID=2688777 RepID=UPI0012B2B924|nr:MULTISPECIES: rod shape-determining protein MreD [unclassified Paracoccus (in: a-proteobacteria)]UXU74267.1 rod shape-determining protein MreD [Paracoccus sp. SMMA_5]UXU80158.1 rod shape-determining protein MreD [Paracoccus sp. SMMA_5_TC]